MDLTKCTLPTEIAQSIAQDFEEAKHQFPDLPARNHYIIIQEDLRDSEGDPDDVYNYTEDELDTFVAEVSNNFKG